MAEGRWFPVYYEDLAEHYAAVWDDARLFWTWARLYAIHDRAWPLPGELPRGVTQAALTELATMELITLLPKHRFLVRGLDARRNAQRNAASIAARSRHGSASGNAYQTKPNQTKTRDGGNARALGPIPVKDMDGAVVDVDVQSEIPTDLTRLQKLAEELTGVPYVMANVHGGLGKKAWQEQLLPHGYSRVERAWRGIHNRSFAEGSSPPTLRQLVLGADDILNPVPAGREMRRDMGREDENARFDRRVANTQRRLAAIRNEESA